MPYDPTGPMNWIISVFDNITSSPMFMIVFLMVILLLFVLSYAILDVKQDGR